MTQKVDAELDELRDAAARTQEISSQIRSDGATALQAMDIVEGGFTGVGGAALLGFRTALVVAIKLIEDNLDNIGEALEASAQSYEDTDKASADDIAAHNVSTASMTNELRGGDSDATVTQASNSDNDNSRPLGGEENPEAGEGPSTDLGEYTTGPPQKPDNLPDLSENADDFVYDENESASASDVADYLQWRSLATAAENGGALRGLDQAADLYRHYLDGDGETYEVDLAPAYRNDAAMTESMNNTMDDMMVAAQQHYDETGETNFSLSGPAIPHTEYPETEEWQKTLGGHLQWSSGDFVVEDGQISADLTVHSEDRYNFNRDQTDMATGAEDNVNGRFAELGWATSFRTEGEASFETEIPANEAPGDLEYTPEDGNTSRDIGAGGYWPFAQ